MFKKIITTIPATSDAGMLCADCPFNSERPVSTIQHRFCSFYEKVHSHEKPAFCSVELIEVTEAEGAGPSPVFYDRDMNPVPPPGIQISTLEIHDLCHDLLYSRGIFGKIHCETEMAIATWLEGKGITVKK